MILFVNIPQLESNVKGKVLTSPEDAPVATTVFTTNVMFNPIRFSKLNVSDRMLNA